jgi:hypothetical protein
MLKRKAAARYFSLLRGVWVAGMSSVVRLHFGPGGGFVKKN